MSFSSSLGFSVEAGVVREQPEDLVIDNATLLSYSQNTEYFGGDIGFKKVIEISVQCSSSDINNQSGISTESAEIFDFVRGKSDYANLQINGYTYGNAKIQSFSTSEGDLVNTAECSISFLINQSFDDLNSLTGYYADYADAEIDGSLIESFSDSLELSTAENSQGYNRSIQIQANNSLNIPNLPFLIESYIRSILDYGVFSFPDLSAFNENINDLTNSTFKKNITENIDQIGLNFSFEENLTCGNVAGDYSITSTQNYTLSESRVATVTESGEIQGLTEPRIDAAEAGYSTEIENAKTRLEGIYNHFKDDSCSTELNKDSSNEVLLITKSRNVNSFAGIISYSVSSNDDPRYEDGGATWEYNISVEYDGKHTTCTEDGTVSGRGNVIYDPSLGANLVAYPKYLTAKDLFINTVLTDINNRITENIPGSSSPNPTSRSETHSPRKGQISYSRVFSNNPIYSMNDGIAKSVTVQSRDSGLIPNQAKFVSLNPRNSREIVQELTTKSPLVVSNNINVIGYRIDPTTERSEMPNFGNLAASYIDYLGFGSTLKYLNSCNYSFKGANDVIFNLSTSHQGGEDACQ